MATVANKLGYESVPAANFMINRFLESQHIRKMVSRRESGYVMPDGARMRAIGRSLRLTPAQSRLLNI